MEYIFLFILGGYAYHLRGSAGAGGRIEQLIGHPIGTNGGRLIWALFITLLVTGVTGNAWMLLAMPIPAFLGVLLGYFGGEFDLTKKANRNIENYVRLTLRGLWIMFPPMLAIALLHGLMGGPGVFAGDLFVPCYLFGKIIYNWGIKLPLIEQWTEWAQFLLGGLVTVGLVASL